MTSLDAAYYQRWPRFLNAPIERPRTRSVLVGALAIGIAFDLAMRSGLVGAGGTLCVVLACTALAASGRLRNPQSIVLVAAAPLVGMWFTIRTSDWLIPLDVVAVCALVALGCSLSSGASLWDLTIPRVAVRCAQAVTQFLLAPSFLARTTAGRRSSTVAGVVRGAAIAIPVLFVLASLLASADAVFASLLSFDITDTVMHMVLIGLGTVAAAWLFRLASLSYVESPALAGPKLATTESTLVLGALNALLGTFAAAQLIASSQGGQRVIRSAGLTYAEYARSGFFQLLGAAIVTTLTLLALRASVQNATSGQRRLFTTLALGVVAFTVLIVVTAFYRLVLYESVFGLTMLRLLVQTAIVGVGIFLLMLAATVLGIGGQRAWLWPGAGVAALVLLFALNIMDPEAFVARYNIGHEQQIGRLDPSYLNELGDDALPALVTRPDLVGRLCDGDHGGRGWAAFNVARKRANAIRADICP